MSKKKEEPFRTSGALTKEEMDQWARRLTIKRMVEGAPIGFDTDERAFAELSAYKSMPRIFFQIDKNTTEDSPARAVLTALGLPDDDGKKFVLLGADITPEEEKPKKVSKKKPKTFLLNEAHTTHLTKAQHRKEMREARKKRKR